MANRHKRETSRRKPKAAFIAAPLAVLATGVAVTWGVAGSGSGDLVAVDRSAADIAAAARPETVSRGEQRPTVAPAPAIKPLTPVQRTMQPAAVRAAVRKAHTRLWTTDALNLWTRPDKAAKKVGELDAAKRVLVTGRKLGGRVEIVVEGAARWVTQGYLSETKPDPDPATMGLDFSPCGDMSVTNGLVPDMIRAYEAVCNAFPGQVSSYGGLGAREEHNTGHAVDAMVYGDSALGQRIADFLQAHAAELNLYDIIWQQHIWTPVRASEGWRLMPNRGSATANHMDHVHFGVN